MALNDAVFFNGKWYGRDGRPLGDTPDASRLGKTMSVSGAVIAASAGKKIRVFSLYINALAATAVVFQSNATDISGTFSLADNGGAVLPLNALGWFETAVGEPLNLTMSVATTLGLQVLYALVD